MGDEATFPVGGNDPPLFATLAEIPDAFNVDELMELLDESTGHIPPPHPQSAGHLSPDPQFAGDTSHSTIAGLRQAVLYPAVGHGGPTAATGAVNLTEQNNAHPWPGFGCPVTSPGLITYPVGNTTGTFTGMEESPDSWSAPVEDMVPVPENPPRVPTPLDQEVNDGASLTVAEAVAKAVRQYEACNMAEAVRQYEARKDRLLSEIRADTDAALLEMRVCRAASCKRRRPVSGSSSQRSTPPPEFNLLESEAGLVRSDPSSATDIKPPTGSTDVEVIGFLWRQEDSMPPWKDVNVSLGEQDQTAPMGVRSYVTTLEMMPDQKTRLGYWKEIQVKALYYDKSGRATLRVVSLGLKRTFQFHRYDGTKTNWFMHEYVPTGLWGIDLYMKHLRFREVVFEGPEITEVKFKTIAAAKNYHRMRGPENLVIKGESLAWEDLIKVYDRHPELEGSKVVYALCCHCEGVLRAGTKNGTSSLLTHCNRTCPIKNKNQQPSPT